MDTVRADVDWARQNVYEYSKYPGIGGLGYVDAYHLAQLLKQRISDSEFQQKCDAALASIQSVVLASWMGTNATDSHGLHIYFEGVAAYYLSAEYDVLDMSINYLWDNFLKSYLGLS